MTEAKRYVQLRRLPAGGPVQDDDDLVNLPVRKEAVRVLPAPVAITSSALRQVDPPDEPEREST